MKRLGVIGGLGPESTGLFYDEFTKLCQDRVKVEYPNILINSLETWRYVHLLDDEKALVEALKEEFLKIQDHVDLIAIPCNSIHIVIDEIRRFSKVPVLAIYEEVAKEIAKNGVKRVGILGTKYTMKHQFYQKALEKIGIEYEVLEDEYIEKLHSILLNQMLNGEGKGELHNLLVENIDAYNMKGCDSVVLACTELPLFISQTDVDLKLFSSTGILAKAAFDEVFKDPSLQAQ